MTMIIYKITDMIVPLRVSAEQEELGLDISQHGEEYSPGPGLDEISDALRKTTSSRSAA